MDAAGQIKLQQQHQPPRSDNNFSLLAAAADSSSWPPPQVRSPPSSSSYTCGYCKKEFRSAQGLGGHMNVHRLDRAKLIHQQTCRRHTVLLLHPITLTLVAQFLILGSACRRC